jgi:hypothetical protein
LEQTLSTLYFFLIFAVLFGAALWYRHRPSVHKRLMLLAVLSGLTATPVAHVIGHWSVLHAWTGLIFLASSLIFLSFSAIYDRLSEGRIHPVFAVGCPCVIRIERCFQHRDRDQFCVARVYDVADSVAGPINWVFRCQSSVDSLADLIIVQASGQPSVVIPPESHLVLRQVLAATEMPSPELLPEKVLTVSSRPDLNYT